MEKACSAAAPKRFEQAAPARSPIISRRFLIAVLNHCMMTEIGEAYASSWYCIDFVGGIRGWTRAASGYPHADAGGPSELSGGDAGAVEESRRRGLADDPAHV